MDTAADTDTVKVTLMPEDMGTVVVTAAGMEGAPTAIVEQVMDTVADMEGTITTIVAGVTDIVTDSVTAKPLDIV